VSYALVFSGQGTQHPAMLPWLGEDEIVRGMCRRLGVHDWRAAAGDPAWAERNANAQVLLTGLALSAWRQIARVLPVPSAIAGYSVGELAAFSAAGVFAADTALDLARCRAASMDRCAARTPGGLMAVTGLGGEAIETLCARTGLAIAIRNGPQSVILGGTPAALEMAEHALARHNARCARLRVGIASHTPTMHDAADDFLRAVSDVEFNRPRTALFSNAADRVHDADAARRALATQIASTVRWDECMDHIRARQPSCVLEIGAGQALARMWNDRYADIPARSCDEFRSKAGIVEWVGRLGGA
jgi:[acyl-carrier-protein] S-malonyltransferase